MENNQESASPIIQDQLEVSEKSWFIVHKIFIILLVLVTIGGVLSMYYWRYVYTKAALANSNNLKSAQVEQLEGLSNNVVNTTTIPEDFVFLAASSSGWKIQSMVLYEPGVVETFKYISSDNTKKFNVSIFGDVDPDKTTLYDWAKADALKYDTQAKEDLKIFSVRNNLVKVYSGELHGKIYKRFYLIRGIEKKIYRIDVEMDMSDSWMSDFDKIVSTFSFIAVSTDSTLLYKNIQLAFELSYPSNWRVKDLSDGVELRNYYNSSLDFPINPNEFSVRVMQNSNPSILNLSDWLTQNPFWIQLAKSKDFIKIDNHEAVKIYEETPSISYPGGVNRRYVYLILNGKDILVSEYSFSRELTSTSTLVFDKIVQSIRFVTFDNKSYNNIIDYETQKIIGQDINNNGVWDEVDTYLNQNYFNSAKMRASLMQYTKALQQVLIDNRDKSKTMVNTNDELRASDCLEYILTTTNGATNGRQMKKKIISEIKVVILNTEVRLLAYEKAGNQLSGQVFEIKDNISKTQCDFNLDILPN